MSVYIDKLNPDVLSNILPAIESNFPHIRDISRNDRLAMGKKVLLDAKSNKELLSDIRTEVV